MAALYLDRNADGVLNAGDKELGTLVLEKVALSSRILDVMAGYTTSNSDDTTLIFKVVDEDDKVVTSTSVKVDY